MALHKPEHRTFKYWVLYLPRVILYCGALPMALFMGRHDEPKGDGIIRKWDWEWYRNLEDKIDDPIDWLKYKFLGIGELP